MHICVAIINMPMNLVSKNIKLLDKNQKTLTKSLRNLHYVLIGDNYVPADVVSHSGKVIARRRDECSQKDTITRVTYHCANFAFGERI